MATKIRAITIITLQGTKCYCVGGKYNGLDLASIEDRSLEFPDSLSVIYMGFTRSGDTVFEVIDAPIDVEYEPV